MTSLAFLTSSAGRVLASIALLAPSRSVGQQPKPIASIAGLQTPVAAVYDSAQDVFFVSSVGQGNGDAHDRNGFISRIRGDGTVEALRWLASDSGKRRLDGPKGLALSGDTLWVADVDTVRAFDRRTGRPIATIGIPHASFLNG